MPGQQGPTQQQAPQADGRNSPYPVAVNHPRPAERTIASLYGSTQEMDRLCETEVLPESTGKSFPFSLMSVHANVAPVHAVNILDRDPSTNRVLWFSGPPIDIIVPERPKHSAAYLAFLAKKRLQYTLGEDEVENGHDVKDVHGNGNGKEEGDEKGDWVDIEKRVETLVHGA